MADEGRERPPDPGVERVNELMSPCNGKCAEVSVRMGAGGVCGEHSRPVAREQEEESSEPLTQEPPVEEGSVRQGGEVRRDHGQVVDRAMEPSIILPVGHELGPGCVVAIPNAVPATERWLNHGGRRKRSLLISR